MKKYIFGLFASILFLSGCADEYDLYQDMENGSETVKVTFAVNIPAFKVATRQSLTDENTLNNLFLLVFDEKGNFIERVQATVSPSNATNGTFSATLPANKAKRIIHFIANYNWSGFDDEVAKQKDEREIVAALKGNELYMWSRMELANGITATSFDGRTVQLIRNMAKITVVQSGGLETQNFTEGTFAVRNMPTIGTIAPFNPNAGAYMFAEHAITEPAGVAFDVNGGYKSFGTTAIANAEFVFERKNAAVTTNNYTYVILRGKYNALDSYYKIDIIDSQKKRYDIERNYWYKLTINKVLRPGYATEQQAMDNAAANNTSLDVTIEKYPIITDGVAKLEVEKTLIVFTQNGATLDTWAHYFPNVQTSPTTIDNSSVTVTLIEDDPANPLVKDAFIWNPATGNITANIHNIPADGSHRTAHIQVTKGDLTRTIRLLLRPAYSFSPITINGTDPGVVSPAQDANALLKFTIPADYPTDLMPVEVKIATQGLYPANDSLQMVVENGQIYYIYTATSKGLKTVPFKITLSANREVIRLNADRFNEGRVAYNMNFLDGTIAYRDIASGSVETPVPYAQRANLKARQGFISMSADGKYRWSYPATFNAISTDRITFTRKISDVVSRIYSADVSQSSLAATTPPNKITLTHTHSTIKGAITYGNGTTVPNNTPVPQDGIVTASTGNISVTANGVYEYTFPVSGINATTPVTLTYEAHITGNVYEIYTATTTFGALSSGNPINLSTLSRIIIWGNIYYGNASNLVPRGAGSATATGVISFEVYQRGKYRLELQGNTPDARRIAFSYQSRWTYTLTRTLAQLRANSTVALQ